MQKRLFLLAVILMGTLLFCFSCEEKGVKPKVTAGELINQGWQKFDAGNSAGAGADFSAALSITTNAADSSEAFLGLGWAQLKQNQAGLTEKSLLRYLSFNPGVPGLDDGRAGLALAYSATSKFREAIDTANVVLSSNPTWSFGHDPSVNYLDLYLILAQSYYELADFYMSLEMVQYFDPNFDADPNTPEGRKNLADKIEELWDQVTT
jgi:tetratricopeptide (TPR) repeat protein